MADTANVDLGPVGPFGADHAGVRGPSVALVDTPFVLGGNALRVYTGLDHLRADPGAS